jgi:hypothetical protein
VMDLAGRVFDVIAKHEHRHDDVRQFFPPDHKLQYGPLFE